MDYPCELIMDLVPLVNDGCASQTSAEIVSKHLQECSSCRERAAHNRSIEEALSVDHSDLESTTKNVVSYGKRLKKKRILIASLISVGVLFFCGMFWVVQNFAVLFGSFVMLEVFSSKYSTTDIAEYGVFEGHIEAENAYDVSLLWGFPKEILPEYSNVSYSYYCNNGGLDNTYQIYLEYTLPKALYEAETERLSNLSITYRRLTNRAIYSEDAFAYPAYVLMADPGTWGNYEYVLLDEEHQRIICVLSVAGRIENMPLSENCLPKKSFYSLETSWPSYSMYLFPFGGIDGAYFTPDADQLGIGG